MSDQDDVAYMTRLGIDPGDFVADDGPLGDDDLGEASDDEVLAAGAQPLPPSPDGPMGIAKIPFADLGSVALHGGGDLLLLGKPVSGGCVRARDADLLRVIAWLHLQRALGPPVPQDDGEVHRFFQRPARMLVR